MTCPSCGRTAGVAPERCARCGSRLDIPTDRPGAAPPIVRAPTNRGEAAQRAAGIFAVSLVPVRPAGPVPPVVPSPVPGAPAYGAPAYGAPAYGAPAYGAPVTGAPASGAAAGTPLQQPAPAAPAPADVYAPEVRYPALGPRPTWSPPDATQAQEVLADPAVGPARPTSWATQAPPPPAVSTGTIAPNGQAAPVDVTAAFPSMSGSDPGSQGTRDQLPATDAARSAEEPEDARHRTVRPGVDASWPPPPGPWSGRRTSES